MLGRLLLVLFGIGVALILVEGAVRFYYAQLRWSLPRTRPAFAARSSTEAADPLRLAVVGGSTSQGSPYAEALRRAGSERTFNLLSITRHLLVTRYGYPAIEVDTYANGGWPAESAIDSYWENAVHRPDLLVLYTGQNEHWSYYRPNMFPPPGALSWLSVLSSGDLLLRRMFTSQARADDRIYKGTLLSENSIPEYELRFNRERFGHYVEALIRHSKSEGILLLIVIPESNHVFPPRRSIYDGPEDRTAEALRLFKRAMTERYVRGNAAGAKRLFEQLARYASFADLHYELGRIHYELGHWEEARRRLRRAIDLDAVGHTSTEYRDLLIALAKENGVPYIDMRDIIIDDLGTPVPDYSVFVDGVHFRPHLYEALSRRIVAVLDEQHFANIHLRKPRGELALGPKDWSTGLGLDDETIALGWLAANVWMARESDESFLQFHRLTKALQIFRTLDEAGHHRSLITPVIEILEGLLADERTFFLDWLATDEVPERSGKSLRLPDSRDLTPRSQERHQ
jgi:tetratricopeptide (TPR) repeat protein